uniref:Flagellum associated containing coiled-coil domains 1 n=1 Tax=Sus scrofa TaxID=9823 RepID=A0A8D1VB63_PIG
MYPNPLIYCTCWDPWNLGPRRLIKTPQPPRKTSPRKLGPGIPPRVSVCKMQGPSRRSIGASSALQVCTVYLTFRPNSQEVINVSPGYRLIRNREQVSVTLGDEIFERKKLLESEHMNKVNFSRTDIVTDLEEQISELTVIIEQMNRDHHSAQKLVGSGERFRDDCGLLLGSHRELEEAHAAQLSELEKNYKAALKAEKLAAQDKLDAFLHGNFMPPQDSIYDEMEDKWSKKKAEWEKDEKLEREKILLQQKHRITKKFELESEEEKKKLSDSYSAIFENFNQEKEVTQPKVLEEELHAQALILESLNTTLYQTQMELQREKAMVANLEKALQSKLAEAEEKFQCTIQHLTEENILLRNRRLYLNLDGRLLWILPKSGGDVAHKWVW